MTDNAELDSEQAYIDHAYECLERSRKAARAFPDLAPPQAGGTFQARFERDVLIEVSNNRLAQLELGDQSLCFGRIDHAGTLDPSGHETDGHFGAETFYIGRIAVSDEHSDPVIVDWRAPVAEPFYRATGRDPMGLARRRHFASQGRVLRGLEDEFFGEATEGLDHGTVAGQGALIAALEEARSGLSLIHI